MGLQSVVLKRKSLLLLELETTCQSASNAKQMERKRAEKLARGSRTRNIACCARCSRL